MFVLGHSPLLPSFIIPLDSLFLGSCSTQIATLLLQTTFILLSFFLFLQTPPKSLAFLSCIFFYFQDTTTTITTTIHTHTPHTHKFIQKKLHNQEENCYILPLMENSKGKTGREKRNLERI